MIRQAVVASLDHAVGLVAACVELANQALQAFRAPYNHNWLIERHKHHPPAWVRQNILGQGAVA